jgi:Protein of unknown function (DUF4031)
VAVLIDPPHWPAHGRLWSHLVSDTSLTELHEFAARVGLPRRGFDADHYDVPAERHVDTVAAGAQPVDGRELLRRLQASGLRRPKRHSDRLLASSPVDDDGLRVDALAGAVASRPAPVRVTALIWFEGSLLVTGEADGAAAHPPVLDVGPAPLPSQVPVADLDLHLARTALAAWLGLDDAVTRPQQSGPRVQVSRLGQLRTVHADTGRPVHTTSVIRVVTPWRGAPVSPAHWWRLPLVLGRLDPLIEAFVTGSAVESAAGGPSGHQL